MVELDRDVYWDEVYRSRGPELHSWFEAVPETSLAMIGRAALDPGDAVLDVGAGTSALAQLLSQRGFRVTALDVSASAIDQARRRARCDAGAIEWVVADVLTWAAPGRFRLVHDRAVFHFLTDPADRNAYVARLRDRLEPGGQLVLSTFAADGPERCSGQSVARYDAPGLTSELGPGFRIEEVRQETHRTPGGVDQRFISIRARFGTDPRSQAS